MIIIPNGDRSSPSPYKTQCEENSSKSTLSSESFYLVCARNFVEFDLPIFANLCNASARPFDVIL